MGGDTAEVNDIKFSNDGKSMLLTTTNNNISWREGNHVLYLSPEEDRTLGFKLVKDGMLFCRNVVLVWSLHRVHP